MGNLLAAFGISSYDWYIFRSRPSPRTFYQVKSYEEDHEQRIKVTGPLPLECTISVDNAIIDIGGREHRISLIGSNNSITFDADTQIRINGDDNALSGNGHSIVAYTDNGLLAQNIIITRMEYDSENAPPILHEELQNQEPPNEESEQVDQKKIAWVQISFRCRNVPVSGSETSILGVKRKSEGEDAVHNNNNNEEGSSDKRAKMTEL